MFCLIAREDSDSYVFPIISGTLSSGAPNLGCCSKLESRAVQVDFKIVVNYASKLKEARDIFSGQN